MTWKETWQLIKKVLSDKHGSLPYSFAKQDPKSKFFPLPNCIFNLGLDGGEILVYAYLMYCEDRKTFKCHPSYSTIGEAVGMSINTVQKYVKAPESKKLISTEYTTVHTKDGRVHNGSLEYTIRPIQDTIDYYDEVQMRELYRQQAAANAQRALEEYDRKHGRSSVSLSSDKYDVAIIFE